MVSERKLDNAMGGKTARACDSCIKKRARWYCAADDAFLCQACDLSVHSANPLARRHERVRLKTASIKHSDKSGNSENTVPTWHRGFTRKARTPRQGKHSKTKSGEPILNPLHLVPEMYSEENSHDENEEQLLYRVPIFDPFVAELCNSSNSNEASTDIRNIDAENIESKAVLYDCSQEMNHVHGFLPSEMDLAEFAADVESLLGKGLDDESFDMEGLGLLNCEERDLIMECSLAGDQIVKVEDDEDVVEVAMADEHIDLEMDMERSEPFELSFDYDSPLACEEDNSINIKAQTGGEAIVMQNDIGIQEDDGKKKKILLNLDYEGVISAWNEQRSPWTTGERPELDSADCWPDCTGSCGTVHAYADMGMMGINAAMINDGGREARVSRYREKRRTRLFSKKIRYEVRKLNAEKRPRMKGRFVKRSNFAGPAFPLLAK